MANQKKFNLRNSMTQFFSFENKYLQNVTIMMGHPVLIDKDFIEQLMWSDEMNR